MSKTISNFIKLAPPGTKCDGAHVQYELKGREIKATPSVGTKPAPKDLTLIGLLDAAQIDPKTPLEAADERSFEVRTGASMVTLEASKRDLASVKAVLVINGKITDPNVVQSFRDNEKNEEMLQQHRVFGDQPGLIVKVRRVMCAVRASHARRSRLSGVSSRLRPRHHRRTLQHIMFAMWGDKSVGGGRLHRALPNNRGCGAADGCRGLAARGRTQD